MVAAEDVEDEADSGEAASEDELEEDELEDEEDEFESGDGAAGHSVPWRRKAIRFVAGLARGSDSRDSVPRKRPENRHMEATHCCLHPRHRKCPANQTSSHSLQPTLDADVARKVVILLAKMNRRRQTLGFCWHPISGCSSHIFPSEEALQHVLEREGRRQRHRPGSRIRAAHPCRRQNHHPEAQPHDARAKAQSRGSRSRPDHHYDKAESLFFKAYLLDPTILSR